MKTKLTVLLTLLAAWPAAAEDYLPFTERYGHQFENEQAWDEAAVILPDYPEAGRGNWFALYVNPTYANQAEVLLPLEKAADGSLRYVLSIRAPGGEPNYTYEGIRCHDLHQRPFAFGDNGNRRWIAPRNAQWRLYDNYRTAADPVRGRLMRIFCEDGIPRDAAEAEQRLQRFGKRS